MGTKKGQRRKTARRAYEKRKKPLFDKIQRGGSTRRIGGKMFQQDVFAYTTKEKAQARAGYLRRQHGMYARIVKFPKGYSLFMREK